MAPGTYAGQGRGGGLTQGSLSARESWGVVGESSASREKVQRL